MRSGGGTPTPEACDTTTVPTPLPFLRRAGDAWQVVRVTGESMAPTLRPGDLLLLRRGAVPRAGDLVVADLPGGRGPGVKRAVRQELAGWWVERDNPATGADSWLFGAVPVVDVHGVVRARLWPRPGRLRPRPGAPR